MKPAECSLLVAIPRTEREYSAAIGRGSDFLKENKFGPEDWERYEGFVRPIFSVCEESKSLGANLVYSADLGDLSKATRSSGAVTIVAHMRSSTLRSEDIVDARAMLTRARSGSEPEFQAVRAVGKELPSLDTARDAINLLITKSLSVSADTTKSSYAEAERLRRQSMTAMGILRFDLLKFEELFGSSILRPSQVVEFASKMVNGAEFVDAIDPSFRGFLDLSLCSSAPLGALIGRSRPFLRGNIGVGKKATFAEAGVVLFMLTMKLMSGTPPSDSKGLTYREAKEKMVESLR